MSILLGLVPVLGVATAAQAAVALAVTIQATNATTQPSASEFRYQINLACSGTNAPACRGTQLIIPLDGSVDMSGWGFDVTGGGPGFIQSWAVSADGENLVVVLADVITAGSSQSIVLSVTPPNLTTPDGTTWSLLPRVESEDADTTDTVAPAAAHGTATASVPLVVAKSTPRSFYEEGEAIPYTVRATCPSSPPAGSLQAETLVVVDTVPAGIEPDETTISGDGEWDAVARTITWTYPDAASVPTACGGAGPATQTFSATVGPVGPAPGDAFPSFAEVTNQVQATATPVGGGTATVETGERTVVVLDTGDNPQPGTHSLGKGSAGPLNISGNDTPDLRGTYPGRWLPNGNNSGAAASVLEAAPAQYTLRPRIQYEEFQYDIHDKMPCLDNPTGTDGNIYVASATTCANPAFNVLGIRIDYSGAAPAAGYTPRFVDLAGVEHDLVFQTSGSNWAGWVIPTGSLGQVSEIIIPRDVSQEFRRSDNITVYGYADPTTERLDVLRNVAQIEWFLRDDTTDPDPQTSNAADIFILDAVQLGMRKTVTEVGGVTGTNARVALTATLFTPRAPDADLVVTDLLPAGTNFVGDPNNLGVTVTLNGATSALPASGFTVEAIENYADGRTLVRLVVKAAALPAEAGRFGITLSSFDMTKPAAPGTYTNSAQVFYDTASLTPACAPGGYRSSDPLDLRVDPAAAEANCEASATFRSASSASGQFLLVKTVQGDDDTSPQAFPNVGHVSLEDGTAQYRIDWTNTGAPTLEGVVLYDIFPHIGDTGVIGVQAGEPRDSEFRPLLAAVDTPPVGVVLEFSASGDPCRPEVYPGQPACTDDWTTDVSTLGGLANVLAIRLVSSSQYLTGEGFGLGFQMSVPTVDADQVAWNSVAGYAQDLAGIGLEPTEPPKVGITASDDRFGLEKDVDEADAIPGDTLNYDVTVSNQGTRTTVATEVVDQLPEGLTFVAASDDGTYDPGARTVTWDVPALDRGDAVVFTVTATVTARQDDDSLVNLATLVNPAGYSPPVVGTPCADDDLAACAVTRVPPTPRLLGMTGYDLGAGGLIAAVLALVAGMVLVTRSQARRREM
ncbi:MAG: hypothetical protein ABIR17_00040 [Pseudolysinimonas sp.]|uniref:hypothetical protein n=1 Tax=Pseudolysinimonas sp. TaxID=2680009 RepID=UPI0032677E0A